MKHQMRQSLHLSGCILLGTVSAVFAQSTAATSSADKEVNVYTYREPALIKPLFEKFTAASGVKVNILFAKEGLEERVATEGAQSPADLIISTDISRLASAIDRGIAQPIVTPVIEKAVPAHLRDASGLWTAISTRARVIYASKERVKENELSYESLADPKWKGRICIRDGQNYYNLGLFGGAYLRLGEEKTEAWLKGIKANLAKKPSGGDREVAKDIASGQCDIGVGNTYYYALMQNNEPERKPWAEAIKVILPKFEGGGTHVNVSGMVLAKYAPHKADAVRLAEWLVSPEAQQIYAARNYEYPVLDGVSLDKTIASYGKLSPETTSLSSIAAARSKVSQILNKIGFNDGP